LEFKLAKVTHLEQYGNQIKLTYDDGSWAMAFPTSGGLWYISDVSAGPGPGPGPGATGFSWPFSLSNVSSEFGPRTGPIGSFHEGIDFSGGTAHAGAKIFATNDGTVEKININSNYGYSVQLFHGVDAPTGYGLHTLYAHFQSFPMVGNGDRVVKGQQIGVLGASGDAQGAHLHFETHTCPNNGPIRHNTNNTTDSLTVRTAINPRAFMTTYGDGAVIPQ
jgi:murein DD-endopeptidase MepM/ murein hydrolase activator NlpD